MANDEIRSGSPGCAARQVRVRCAVNAEDSVDIREWKGKPNRGLSGVLGVLGGGGDIGWELGI